MGAMEGEERKANAGPLKPKPAAPAQKQKQIPRAAALVMTTKDGYGVAEGKSRTRLLWAERLRFKARALLARAGRSKARRVRHPFLRASQGEPFEAQGKPRCGTDFLLEQVQNHAFDASLEAGERSEIGGRNVAINVVRVLMIGEIGRIDSQANLPALGMFREWNMERNLPVKPGIHGKVSREAQAVGRAHIALQNVDIRIGKARMHVHDGTELHFPWKPENSRCQHAMGHIGRQNAGDIRPDDGSFEENQRIGKRIEIALGAAPRIGDGQVRVFARPIMRGDLRLAIVRAAGVPKRRCSFAAGRAELLIEETEVCRVRIEVPEAEAYVFAHLAFEFDIPDKRAGACLRTERRAGSEGRYARGKIGVLQNNWRLR